MLCFYRSVIYLCEIFIVSELNSLKLEHIVANQIVTHRNIRSENQV